MDEKQKIQGNIRKLSRKWTIIFKTGQYRWKGPIQIQGIVPFWKNSPVWIMKKIKVPFSNNYEPPTPSKKSRKKAKSKTRDE